VARPSLGAHALVMPIRPLLLILAWATTPCVARPADPGSPEAPIPAQVARFVSAWNEHDVRALSRLFADAADFVNVVGIWWKSRREIEAAHAATHQTLFKASTLSGQVASVKPLRPDVAVVHAAWTLIGSRTPDGRPMPERKASSSSSSPGRARAGRSGRRRTPTSSRVPSRRRPPRPASSHPAPSETVEKIDEENAGAAL
jgi:uncharacterized protein (TIGR02246 family)